MASRYSKDTPLNQENIGDTLNKGLAALRAVADQESGLVGEAHVNVVLRSVRWKNEPLSQAQAEAVVTQLGHLGLRKRRHVDMSKRTVTPEMAEEAYDTRKIRAYMTRRHAVPNLAATVATMERVLVLQEEIAMLRRDVDTQRAIIGSLLALLDECNPRNVVEVTASLALELPRICAVVAPL